MTAQIRPHSSPRSPKLRPILAIGPSLLPLLRSLPEPYAAPVLLSWEELDGVLLQAPPSTLVVVDPYANVPAGHTFPRIRGLLRRFPSIAVVAAMELRPAHLSDVLTLLDWGVAEFVALGIEATEQGIASRLGEAHARPLKRRLSAALSRFVRREAWEVLNAAAEIAVEGGLARDLADRLEVGARTLNERCARAGLPAPRHLQAWMRLLLAALLLDDPGRTVYGAAYAAGYRTDRSLRRAITNYLGVDSTALRGAGAFATAAATFDASLRDARERARAR